jgi:hypothetical protein
MTGTPWNCKKCGVTLGHWERRDLCSHHAVVLVTIVGPEIIGIGRVPCKCGIMNEWEPGRVTLNALIERVLAARGGNNQPTDMW